MATSKAKQSAEVAPVLGKEGDPCAECGKPLAADQRYCLNCGQRRTAPRVDFEQHLSSGGEQPSANGAAVAPTAVRGWSPLVAIVALALLGVMLLVGVLIGKEDNDDNQSATTTAPAAVQSPAPTTATPTTAPPTVTPVPNAGQEGAGGIVNPPAGAAQTPDGEEPSVVGKNRGAE